MESSSHLVPIETDYGNGNDNVNGNGNGNGNGDGDGDEVEYTNAQFAQMNNWTLDDDLRYPISNLFQSS